MYALLSDEQVALRDAVDALARSVGLSNPVDLQERTPAQGWSGLEQMGLLELRRRDGDRPTGSGVEVMVAAQSLAAGLVPVPFLPSAVLATELLAIGGAPEEWLDQASSMEESYAILLSSDLRDLATTETLDDAVAWGATTARFALAVTPTDDGPRLSRLRLPETPATNASVDLTQGIWPLPPSYGRDSAGLIEPHRLTSWRALALSGVCADLVGVMRAALAGAVAYSKQRVAYGQPIGSFQAIQHMAAETHVTIEAAYGATCYAAWCVDEVDAETALLAARTAKAYCASVARTATENVMQIYGGVGQTWEHIAHFFTRRALLGTQLFGDEAAQLEAIARTRLEGI